MSLCERYYLAETVEEALRAMEGDQESDDVKVSCPVRRGG